MSVLMLFFFITVSQALPQASEDSMDPNFVGIINGFEVVPYSLPYQVGIIINRKNFKKEIGSGSLISHHFVLTAAHLLHMTSSVKLLFGVHYIYSQYEEGRVEKIVNSTNFITHPEFSISKMDNDIGLIRLEDTIVETNHIGVITLASEYDTYTDKLGFVAGWGKTTDQHMSDVLYYIKNEIIPNYKCKTVDSFHNKYVGRSKICLSGFKKNNNGITTIRTTCHGDSGSPLVVDSVQVGIYTWGEKNCMSPKPTVFMRVSEYYSWIQNNTMM